MLRWIGLIFGWLTVTFTLASDCYPDYCQHNLTSTSGYQCILTRVQTHQGCAKLDFGQPSPSRTDAGRFRLSAYIKYNRLRTQRITAFNLSVTDANFDRLVTRYQNLEDKSQAACRYIELIGNQTHPPPKELYVSCPFSNASFESSSYRLQYHVTGQNYQYGREYIFKVPLHSFIGDYIQVKDYTLFAYIDVSDSPYFTLYVQPYPAKYNVTDYRVWIINNDTNSARVVDIIYNTYNEHIRYNFTAESGVYRVTVSGVHPDCGKFGCANSTTPFIYIKENTHRILIMIISTVWIPPVALYALYHFYKLYRERELLKWKKGPSCLLVYSPSRLTHINVMTELAKYLRGCKINAMIDMLDVASSPDKDASVWCEAAFNAAETIVIAVSPCEREPALSSVYRNNQDYISQLLKENATQRAGKRYCVIQFPYCSLDTVVSEEGRNLERFSLPKELPRLVKFLRKSRRSKRFSVSDRELLESIRLAKMELLEENVESAKDTNEIDGLLEPGLAKRMAGVETVSDDIKSNSIPQSFATNIDELNLLGETEENKNGAYLYKPSTSETAFRIDQLNL